MVRPSPGGDVGGGPTPAVPLFALAVALVRWRASGCTTRPWRCCAVPWPPDAAAHQLAGLAGVACWRSRGAWPLAGGRLAGAGGLLGRQGLLHGLLDQGLQVGGWRGGRRLWDSGRPCGRGLALLAEEVKVGLPLPCLVEDILHPWHEVLHAAGELGVADVPHRVHEFDLAYAKSQATAGRGLVDVPAVGAGELLLAGVLGGGWRRCWRCFSTGMRRRASGGFRSRGRGAAGRGRAVEQGQCPAVQLDGERMRAELGPVRGVGAGAVRRQAIGLLPALHAGGAIRVEGHGVGQDQCQRLVQAVGQDLDAEFRTQLLAHLGDGVLPALSVVGSLVGSGDAGVGWSPKHSAISVVSGSQGAGVCGTVAIIISPFVEG